jgi:chromosome partitioning protein
MTDEETDLNGESASSTKQFADRLLGLAEVADLLGASRPTVANWRQRRRGFPSPVADLKSGPIWRHIDIVDWASTNGIKIAEEASVAEGSSGPLATTVALMNMKGGVGKSTLTANLGWWCAYRKNHRVLLIDLDPQFNLSQYVMGNARYEEHLNANKGTTLDVFEQNTPRAVSKRLKEADSKPRDVIAHVRSWSDGSAIDIVPSRLELSWTLKSPGAGKELLLSNFLDEVRPSYDTILIDCSPMETMFTTAAYLATDAVLVPVKPEFLSTIGLPLLVRSIADFEHSYKRSVAVMGVVFNATTEKLEHDRSRSFVRKVSHDNSWYVFSREVSYSDSYAKGSRYGKPIFLTEHARSWKIEDFEAVAQEFFGRLAS